MSPRLNSCFLFALVVSLAVSGLTRHSRAANVGATGYTNDFSVQPAAADWSMLSVAGGAGDLASAAAVDAAVQTIAPTAITAITTMDPNNPPAALTDGVWSSSGLYLQTRPTGNRMIMLRCSLVNTTGASAAGARISYDFAKIATIAEESEGHRVFYRLSSASTWTLIQELSSTASGRVTGNANVLWPAGVTMYLAWADDNGSLSPDTALQIDNFSATTLPFIPLAITNQPQSVTATVGSPFVLTVGVSGSLPTYQWQRDNGAGGWITAPGISTFASYTNAAASFSAAGMYRAIVSNPAGTSLTSQVAIVSVVADTFGPIMLEALVSELNNTNTITIKFNEKLTSATVISNNFAIYQRAAGATNRVTIDSVFYNASTITVPESFAVVRVSGANWNISSNAYNGTINYFVIANNVRDASNNVVAPNSAIGLAFPNNVVTNVLTWNSEWLYHTDWGNPFNPDPTIYQQPWNQVSYDPATNGHWGTVYGVCYKDTLILPTFVPCQGTLGTEVTYVINPTLFRTTFVWPTNYTTNVVLRLQTVVDDGAIVYVNGVEVQRINVGTATLDETTRSTTEYVDGQCISNNNLVVSLRPGTNVLGIAVCQYNVPGVNGGDIFWGARLDVVQTSLTVGAVPRSTTNTNILRPLITKVSGNTMRLNWWTNVEPTHSNNFYNYTVVYATNITRVGNSNFFLPEFQMQPGIANGMETNFTHKGLPYFIRLKRVP